MVKAVDIRKSLAGLPVLDGRNPDTTEADAAAAFATLAEFGEQGPGGVFAGSFRGESPWERHPNGDELVQVLDGATRLTILVGAETHVLELTAGMMVMVPKGCWHRFEAPDGVTVMTATPQPTDHSAAEDPRRDG